MQRNKHYSAKFGVFEALVLIITHGYALFYIVPRELYRWSVPKKTTNKK